MIIGMSTIISRCPYMTSLYDDIDVTRTIEIIFKYHKHNKLALRTGYRWESSFRYEADDDRCDACAKALKKLGFTGSWSSGVTKICFPHHSNWVVKLPILKAWSPLLLAEVTLMNQAPKKLRPYFPETLVFEQGRYMFQEKCYISNWYNIPDNIKKAANSLGLRDLHSDNFGKSQSGVWKIIDLQTPKSLSSVQYYRRGDVVAA